MNKLRYKRRKGARFQVCVDMIMKERGKKKEGRRGTEKCFDLSAMTNGEPELTLLLLHARHTQTHTSPNISTHTSSCAESTLSWSG